MPNHLAISTVLLSGAVSAGASYVAARISQYNQQQRATENYKRALVSEIRALHRNLIRYGDVFHARVVTGEATSAQVLQVLLHPGAMAVFTNNASAIGFFRGQTALRVLRFYSDVRTLHGHALLLSEVAGAEGRNLTQHEILHHEAMLRHARRRAHALVKQLKQPSLAAVTLGPLRRRARRAAPALTKPALQQIPLRAAPATSNLRRRDRA